MAHDTDIFPKWVEHREFTSFIGVTDFVLLVSSPTRQESGVELLLCKTHGVIRSAAAKPGNTNDEAIIGYVSPEIVPKNVLCSKPFPTQ